MAGKGKYQPDISGTNYGVLWLTPGMILCRLATTLGRLNAMRIFYAIGFAVARPEIPD